MLLAALRYPRNDVVDLLKDASVDESTDKLSLRELRNLAVEKVSAKRIHPWFGLDAPIGVRASGL